MYLRAGEANALQLEDLNLERGVAHIHHAADGDTGELKPTKTSIARRIMIGPSELRNGKTVNDISGGAGNRIRREIQRNTWGFALFAHLTSSSRPSIA